MTVGDDVRIAVVPARGGSKRIPRKNIMPFRGKPLLERTIEMLSEVAELDRIVVSTDDEEIAALALAAGAEVPFLRPPEISDDHTGTRPVIQHAIAEVEAASGARVAEVCTVYPAAIFVTRDDIATGHRQLVARNAEFVMSAAAFPAPVQRALSLDPEGRAAMLWPETVNTRSQDLVPAYHDAGQFYWGTREAWLQGPPVMQARTFLHLLPHWRVQDIDTPEDWERAELLHRLIEAQGS